MKNMNNNYTILHCHTMLSNGVTNIDSVTKYTDYIEKAKEYGMTAFAFSEHGSIFEWVHKKNEIEKAGMKYIHAEEFYITKTLDEKIRDNYHCLLIAKNYDGVLELNKLSSKSFNREDGSYYYVPRISYEDLKNTSDNIIISTACLAGILSKADRDMKNDFFRFIFKHKDRCFLELQPHLDEQQIKYNRKLYDISCEYGINCVMCTDTHALNKEHIKGRSILQRAKNIHFDNEDNFHLEMLSYDELVDLCKQQINLCEQTNLPSIPLDGYLDAIETTNKIANMVEPFKLNYDYKYPHLWGDDSERIFKQKIMEGIKERGVNKYPNYQEYIDRIKYELEAYKHNEAIDFMLLMEDIVSWCKTQDIQIGYGRGSCNGSVIAYLLGITEMDSIKFKLNFDRFMNIERVSLSDIDTDFPPNRIDEVKKYIFNHHGLYCCDIVTFNTIALKGAIRDVGRALDMSLDIIGKICDSIEINESNLREQYKELFEYVDLVNGVVVSVGNHPCFTADTLVYTSNGYKEIQNINIGDMVLTHTNTYKKIIDIMRNYSNDIYNVWASSSLPITTTGNHPFYVRKRQNKRLRKYKDGIDTTVRTYIEPEWINVSDINKGDLVGYSVNSSSIVPIHKEYSLDFYNNDLWWIIGRYLGDGWITSMLRDKKTHFYNEEYLVICCAHDEKEEITNVLDKLNYKYTIQNRRTADRIYIHNKDLLNYLKSFGKYANGKFIPNEVINLPNNLLQCFFNGYMSADGSYCKNKDSYSFKTTSKKMCLSLIQCVAKLYHRHCCVVVLSPKQEIIEGRIVNSKEKYNVTFTKNVRKGEKSFYENGYIWCPCKHIEKKPQSEEVYNLHVETDNSYTANNIIVHNCGLICSPHSIEDRLGTFTTSTDTVWISQINMKEVDSLNYVKLDLLKLDTIQLIADTCKLANIPMLLPDNIDTSDIKVWDSMRDDTTQIFQWEGDTGNDYIKKLLSDENIKKFQEIDKNIDRMTLLSIGNSAIRPAGASYRDDLANGIVRKSGSQAIDDFLKPTFGFLVFQCQIIDFLHNYCGFTMGEADVVRRHFSKKQFTKDGVALTELDIPIITNGGYMKDKDGNEKTDHYISGFVSVMKEKYNMPKEEAEKSIVAFIQVIIDASRYLFSLNHSQPYSYEGFACGWLRYHYPLQFLTVALNMNKDVEEKTKALTNYASKNNIKIGKPLFRYSKTDYFCDSSSNTIYKGIGSIKNIGVSCGDNLYAIKDNKYPSFIYLLNDIKDNKLANTKELSILIRIGFFSEFGDINLLIKQKELFEKFIKLKTLKKSICDENGWDISKIAPYCEKETDKQFSGVNMLEVTNLVSQWITYDESTQLNRIQYQLRYMNYTNLTDPSIPSDIYIVQSIDINKYNTPFISMYHPSTGFITPSYKVKKAWFESNKVNVGDCIRPAYKTKNKWRRCEDGKSHETDEQEEVIENYYIIERIKE